MDPTTMAATGTPHWTAWLLPLALILITAFYAVQTWRLVRRAKEQVETIARLHQEDRSRRQLEFGPRTISRLVVDCTRTCRLHQRPTCPTGRRADRGLVSSALGPGQHLTTDRPSLNQFAWDRSAPVTESSNCMGDGRALCRNVQG